MKRDLTIKVPVLARVEGEGALELSIHAGAITDLKLRIFEPPRLFEKFLEGRDHGDVLDTVARICGICPVAYQMSAAHAIESIFAARPGKWVRDMRRVLYCGEWLESHALHIHLLAAPDFLGYHSAIHLAEKYPAEVKRGLRLQALGNALVKLLGGRSVHPVGVRIGGFFHAPSHAQVEKVLAELRACLPEAIALVKWVGSLDLPDTSHDYPFVCLRHPDEYPMNEGNLVSNEGLDIPISEFGQHFAESHAPQSTALHCHLHGRPYMVGPLARLNLNMDKLPAEVLDTLAATGVKFPSTNMFHSALARAVEVHYAILEAIRILEDYQLPDAGPYVEATPRAGVGYGCTEAPRGILWHRWEMDESGHVRKSTIVPPTSQNQARMEEDLRFSITQLGLDQEDDAIRQRGEMVIRNYDPCISCSTHFLKVSIDRR